MNSWTISDTRLRLLCSPYNAKLPSALDQVLQRALEKEPELRYRTGKEFAEDIDRAMKGAPIEVHDIKATKQATLLKSVEFFPDV